MYNLPPDMMNIPSGMPFVTKLKTKILQTMDMILQCENDERALNGWRLLCTHGVAMVNLALNDGLLDKLPEAQGWKKKAQAIVLGWPPKTAEKTNIEPWGDRYRGRYDHYSVVVNREDVEIGQRSLEQEKYNVICSRLMKFWGDCYSIALIVGYLDLEEEIELPVSREYTSKSLGVETQARRQPKRPNEARSPN